MFKLFCSTEILFRLDNFLATYYNNNESVTKYYNNNGSFSFLIINNKQIQFVIEIFKMNKHLKFLEQYTIM